MIIRVFEILPTGVGGVPGAEIFNYFWTMIMAFGMIAFSVGLLVKVVNRS